MTPPQPGKRRAVPKRDLPDDVEPDQAWRAPDGQHYKVFVVERDRLASLQRCTPGSRVLNARYMTKVPVERMQAQYELVSKP
jgi:hypothetical protein